MWCDIKRSQEMTRAHTHTRARANTDFYHMIRGHIVREQHRPHGQALAEILSEGFITTTKKKKIKKKKGGAGKCTRLQQRAARNVKWRFDICSNGHNLIRLGWHSFAQLRRERAASATAKRINSCELGRQEEWSIVWIDSLSIWSNNRHFNAFKTLMTAPRKIYNAGELRTHVTEEG